MSTLKHDQPLAALSPEQQRVQATVQALWHPDIARDPYPAYEAVRALDPWAWSARPGGARRSPRRTP